MDLLQVPLCGCEFVVVDTETNGAAGAECELTEVGAVLVGGGELHERFSSLVAVREPVPAKIERLTGIGDAMLADAPGPAAVLARLSRMLDGRVLVAHSAAFDRRVLGAAFERAGLSWPQPPVLCTVALARRFAPLVRHRSLGPLAESLGIDVCMRHRALPDAETCARVFCALFGRLCAHAATVGDAVELLTPRRRARRPRERLPAAAERTRRAAARLHFAALPAAPGVYVFRDAAGQALYVGKSVSVRSRARSHFAPGAPPAGWTAHAHSVHHEPTASELGALLLESRTIRRLRPPGNVALKGTDPFVFIRCRLDIAFPILEVARDPAPPGRAVSIGPLPSRSAAVELVEQLNSLFGLRRCGRRLGRREHPSAYGQMDRCLSPCLGDLDPNAYRRRLDAVLALFTGEGDGAVALMARVDEEMRRAAAELRFERAATLRRRRERIALLLGRLGGSLRDSASMALLVLAPGPDPGAGFDAFWLLGGAVADWQGSAGAPQLEPRTASVLRSPPRAADPARGGAELRMVAGWLASHPETPTLALRPPPAGGQLRGLAARASA